MQFIGVMYELNASSPVGAYVKCIYYYAILVLFAQYTQVTDPDYAFNEVVVGILCNKCN